MGTIRYELDEEPFAGTYIEFSDSWTRKEMREWVQAGQREGLSDEEREAESQRFVQLAAQKCTAVNIGSIAQPEQLADEDRLDDLDVRLYQWLTYVIVKLQSDVLSMGEAYGRRLWGMSGTAESQTTGAQDDPQTS